MTRTLFTGIGILVLLAVGAQAQGQTEELKCTNETLKGTYGVFLSGSRPAPSVPVGLPGYVGQLEQVIGTVIQIMDGKGGFTQVDNVKGTISGFVPDRPGKGTYTVNPDCSVISIVSPAPGLQIITKGVIVDGGKEIRGFTVTPEAINLTVTSRRMN